jgi:hypothetical protein
MSNQTQKLAMSGEPVVREKNGRFKLLFTNSRPRIPGGKLPPLTMKTTRARIGERLRKAVLDGAEV